MNWLIVLTALVIVGMLWWWGRGISRPTPARPTDNETPKRKPPARPWQAVSVVHDIGCCPAVMKLGNKRFLAREAPTLPLPNCTHPHCNCRYEYHTDRRDGIDRRALRALRSASSREMEELGVDHERSPGRRSSDLAKARPVKIPTAKGDAAKE